MKSLWQFTVCLAVISINKGAKKISGIIAHYTADPRKDGSTIIHVSATAPD